MCKDLAEILNGMRGFEGVGDEGSMHLRSYQNMFLQWPMREHPPNQGCPY